jgi:hypothetical protein
MERVAVSTTAGSVPGLVMSTSKVFGIDQLQVKSIAIIVAS